MPAPGERPRKRLTIAHWEELSEEERRRETQRAFHDLSLERADLRAIKEGYQRDGAFRPSYRKRVRELAVRSGDAEIAALLDRLDEIAAAKEEEIELRKALWEWEAVAKVIDRARGLTHV